MSTSRILGEAFYIKDGNVGLGTTNPRTILDIQSPSNIYFNVPNIGIGTTRPRKPFDVNGDAIFQTSVGIGTTLMGVAFEVHSTNAILLPRGTNTQRPTIPQGGIRYNTETLQFEGFGAGNVWGSLGGVKSTDQLTYITAEESAGANDCNLRFFTAGVERARINPLGNVGIGTIAPIARLHVYKTDSGDILRIDDEASDNSPFIIKDNGNVGIGTISPITTLHVQSTAINALQIVGSGTVNGVKMTLQNPYGESAKSIVFLDDPASAPAGEIIVYGRTTNSQYLYLALNVNNQERLRINSLGNTGIGTTLPLQLFHVHGSSYISGNLGIGTATPISRLSLLTPNPYDGDTFTIAAAGQPANYALKFRTTSPQSSLVTHHIDILNNGTIPNVLTFERANIGIGTSRARAQLDIEGTTVISGYVGIGTTTPSHALHIYSSTPTDNKYELAGILLENISAGETAIAFRNSNVAATGNIWYMGLNSNSTRFDIGYGLQTSQLDDASADISILSNGNVGIGTTLPVSNFHVNGLSYFDKIYVQSNLQLSPLATTVRNALQVKPARTSQRLLTPQSNISLSMPGYYIAHSSNVQIAINGFMLYHFTSDIANYTLTTSHLNQGTTTQFSIDFTESLRAGDLVDITVWPNVIEVDASQGNVFQIVNNLDSVWNLTTSNVIGIEQFYTKDAYFSKGNLGIGTTQPQYPVDIYASQVHINQVYVTSNSIGIGTALPQYELDVQGSITITGNLYKNNELYVSSQWLTPPLTSNIYVLNSNVGIGTSIPLAKLHVLGTALFNNEVIVQSLSASNLVASNLQIIGNKFFYNNDSTTIRSRLQVSPIQRKFTAPINFTSYTTSTEGLWHFESSNANVYLNGSKLAYISSNQNDYSVSYQHAGSQTNITVSFDAGVVNYMDVLDIELWPSYLTDTASNQPGFVLQNINQTYNVTSNNYISSYSGGYYFANNLATSNLYLVDTYSNVGIGTSQPKTKLDVYGNINIQNGVLSYNTIPIVTSQWSNISATSIAIGSNQKVGIGTTTPFKPLHVDGGVQMSFGPVATTYFNGGDIAISQTGKRYYGFQISWQNSSLTDQKTFRISGQFHMVNTDGTEQGYIEIDTLISPYNNGTTSPKELVSLNANTYITATITELSYDVIRISATSIQLRFKWSITNQPFQLYFEGRVFGTQSLGILTFEEIQGTWT